MQQSLPILPTDRYSCSLSFATISGHSSIVVVRGDLSDGLGIRPLYTFSPTGQLGSINLHALPTRIPLSSPLIAVLNPGILPRWVPSATGVVYNNPINPHLPPFSIQLTPHQPPELGGGIGFRITVAPGRYIDLSLVTGTATSRRTTRSRLYRVRAQVVSFNDCTPTISSR
jgi:hypothetical protein